MDRAKVALGRAHNSTSVATITNPEELSVADRLKAMEDRVNQLTELINSGFRALSKDRRENDNAYNSNSDGRIPAGTIFMGTSVRNGTLLLTVTEDGYCIGESKYSSLSAAAQAASGVRRSGWTFWKTADGRTAKEVFGK
ncbi:hypothetical protein DRN34_00360 [Thermococci archaeon]|nr:MAG: hypothetical protein DRN34_00360 [Thermococci archaeon]